MSLYRSHRFSSARACVRVTQPGLVYVSLDVFGVQVLQSELLLQTYILLPVGHLGEGRAEDLMVVLLQVLQEQSPRPGPQTHTVNMLRTFLPVLTTLKRVHTNPLPQSRFGTNSHRGTSSLCLQPQRTGPGPGNTCSRVASTPRWAAAKNHLHQGMGMGVGVGGHAHGAGRILRPPFLNNHSL